MKRLICLTVCLLMALMPLCQALGEGLSGDFVMAGDVLILYRGTSEVLRLPQEVRVIDASAFRNNETLRGVDLARVEEIRSQAFSGCSKLSVVLGGEALKKIGSRAFADCLLLTELPFDLADIEVAEDAFRGSGMAPAAPAPEAPIAPEATPAAEPEGAGTFVPTLTPAAVQIPTDSRWMDAPENVQAMTSGVSVALTWEVAVPAQSYTVYEMADGVVTRVKRVSTAQAELKDVTPGTHFYFVTPRSQDAAGKWREGTRSIPVVVYVAEKNWQDAPENLQAFTDGSTVRLTWEAEAPASGYTVYETEYGETVRVRRVSGTEAELRLVAPGDHIYTVVPRGKDAFGKWREGTPSLPVAVYIAEHNWQDAPEMEIEQDGSTVIFTWTAPEGAERMGIYEEIDGKAKLIKAASGESFTLKEVTPGVHRYNAAVRKQDAEGKWQAGAHSEWTEVTVTDQTWRKAPTDLRIEADGTTVTLLWETETEVEAVGIYEEQDGKMTYLQTVKTPNIATLTDLTPGDHSYQVGARRKDAEGKWEFGERSDTAAVTIPEHNWQDAPRDLTAEVSGKSVTLTWRVTVPAEAYGVYEMEGDRARFVKTVTGVTSVTLRGVDPGTHVYCVSPRRSTEDGWAFGKRSDTVTCQVE